MTSLIITSKKVLDFYENNSQYDINKINENIVDLLENIQFFDMKNDVNADFLKTCLVSMDKKIQNIYDNQNNFHSNYKQSIDTFSQVQNLIYESFQQNKTFYTQELRNVFNDLRDNHDMDSIQSILTLVRETNSTFLDKILFQIETSIPKEHNIILDNIKRTLETNLEEQIKPILKNNDVSNSTENIIQHLENSIPRLLQSQIESKVSNIFQELQLSHNQIYSQVDTLGKNLNEILEIQKNSTLKGKISEEKLENILISSFPSAMVKNCSGEAKTCDFLIQRDNKPDIYIENKDYKNNVPNEEIKKFIRDIEYQSSHGILLSQNSGVQNKDDFQIDLHMGNILVYVHNTNYDPSKIRIAINIIDHLSHTFDSLGDKEGENISMDELAEINKEYISFINNKKSIIENFKKFYKEHLRQLESFELNKLTTLLNSKFSNVEQLCFNCDICNNFTAKNKRALITHQNKCKKNLIDFK